MTFDHTPVLLTETINALALRPGQVIIDGTLGGGGHTRAILERVSPSDSMITGQVIGFDRDAAAVSHVHQHLAKALAANQLIVIHDSVDHYDHYLEPYPTLHQINGAMLDLGVSAYQLQHPERGFSFQHPAALLDMRMDERSSQTAADVLNTASAQQLKQWLQDYGEEPKAAQLAQRIVQQRSLEPFRQVGQLVDLIIALYGFSHLRRAHRLSSQHVATRTFQALRIVVNQELEQLPHILEQLITHLVPGGRLAVITFHSGEDRIVKQYFQQQATGCICPPDFPVCRCQHQPRVKKITKKPIIPALSETKLNPKSRSAKLRVIEKL